MLIRATTTIIVDVQSLYSVTGYFKYVALIIIFSKCIYIWVSEVPAYTNTKPVRRHLADGARFPHSVSFRYTVDGQTYTARTVLGWYARCPGVGEAVRVYYAPDRPERCALRSEDFLRL